MQLDERQETASIATREEREQQRTWGDHSPIRQQYLGVKRQHPDTILFFRMGDFYEMFDEDAEVVAHELELTLTRRDWGRGERTPMAGVPHHAAEGYIARLIGKGYRVAVCEQVSDPALSKGLVEREVIRVVTPGTVVDPAMLAAKRNNYLAAAVLGRDAVGVAYADITTGEFACTQFAAAQSDLALLHELARVQPAEVLVEAAQAGLRHNGVRANVLSEDEDDEPEGLAQRLAVLDPRLSTVVTNYDPRAFREDVARERLQEQFAVATLEAFGCAHLPLAIRAAGAVVAYLRETQKGTLAQITALETYSTSGFMTLDTHTRRNLELFESGRGGGVKGSLLWVLDATRTPMGGRLLRRWLGEPLLDLARLRQRQDAIEAALAEVALRARVQPLLGRVGDLERLINRVLQRIALPRDLVALAAGLRSVEELIAGIGAVPNGLRDVFTAISSLLELCALLERALVDEPPATLADGGFMREGYSEELDRLRDAGRNGRQWVAELERKERERTGIGTLRVGYNKVFGYYLEVTNSQLGRVPDEYIRKQTITTGERFITPDLKEY
ncbi:MAG TPA: DNA mismatch repair protein MutS, partial [Ktedonobacterales bacterium]|nr:DNA mismatch repair protein MutS [Ktedonobacterales bacterium]